jgi:WD40 repeat protein
MRRIIPPFRVFLSSTFEDLVDERNALRSMVFPKLRAYCERHGARFEAVDLRWGVREEATLDQQTVEICLREVRRCQMTGMRPNFIVLLGDRYGWQPLPSRISAEEFERVLHHLPSGDTAALATQWYRLDENAVPPEYCLQRRRGEFTSPDSWTQIEIPLRKALAHAARSAGLPEAALIKYEASATHQEILAGLSEANNQQVFGFFRQGTEKTESLERLKSFLRERLPGRISEFEVGNMHDLCDKVYRQLRNVIESQLADLQDNSHASYELEADDRFAKDRTQIFVGRHAILDRIASYIRGPERQRLVIKGQAGSGKSALIAAASNQYQGPGLIRRFIGVSPNSASGVDLLGSLCLQLGEAESPANYLELEDAFLEALNRASKKAPLVLFIDAIDQLEPGDPARLLNWIPIELPPFVKVVVSTTEEVEGIVVELGPIDQAAGAELLDGWLSAGQRTLQGWQRNEVLRSFSRCPLPLYLKLAAEESKLWKSYSPSDECLLGDGISGIITTLFRRLASDENHGQALVENSMGYLAAARYGLTEDEIVGVLSGNDDVWHDFVQRSHHETDERRLPTVVWSRLSYDLEPYLTERATRGGMVLAIFHRQLAEHWKEKALTRHADLSRYFASQPAWLDADSELPNARKVAELPFQQRAAKDWVAAETTLMDADFLAAKCAAGSVLDLEADYSAVPAAKQGETLRLVHEALVLSTHVLLEDGRQYASQIFGRLLTRSDSPAIHQFIKEVASAAPSFWVRPLSSALHAPGTRLIRTFSGHSHYVSVVVVTPDGKRAISGAFDSTVKIWELESGRLLRTLEMDSPGVRALAVTADGRQVICACDSRPTAWDLETGRHLVTLKGHSDEVEGLAVAPDGKLVISASRDHTLKVWDMDTGRRLRTLTGHTDSVSDVAVTPDGRCIVSAAENGELRVWALNTGRLLRSFEGSGYGATCIAIASNGKKVISSSGDCLEVWDLDSRAKVRTIKRYSYRGCSVAVLPDGKNFVSAANETILKVWDLDTGSELCSLEGHSEFVGGVAVTPDGMRAISASNDGTLKVWRIDGLTSPDPYDHPSQDSTGHAAEVTAVVITPGGERAVTASADGSLKVWDVETGEVTQTLQGHSAQVKGVALTGDGKQVVSASNDGTVRVWDLDSGSTLRILQDFTGGGVAITPDAKWVISSSADNNLTVRDLETGRVIRTLSEDCQIEAPVVLTPDGKCAISGIEDRELEPDSDEFFSSWIVSNPRLRVWDVETGRTVRTLNGDSTRVRGLAVARNRELVVSASMDETLGVWDLETGVDLQTLEGHTGVVNGVAVMPDGERAVSVSRDRTLGVWDLDISEALTRFHFDGQPKCCAVSRDGVIVVGDVDGHLHFLRLEGPPHLAKWYLPEKTASDGSNRIPLRGGRFAILPTVNRLKKDAIWTSALFVNEHKGRRDLAIPRLPDDISRSELWDICKTWIEKELNDRGMICWAKMRRTGDGIQIVEVSCTTREITDPVSGAIVEEWGSTPFLTKIIDSFHELVNNALRNKEAAESAKAKPFARIDLAVPFAEKDEAKRLGARWDPAKKTWYVADGMDSTRFARWKRLTPRDAVGMADTTSRGRSTVPASQQAEIKSLRGQCGAEQSVASIDESKTQTHVPSGSPESANDERPLYQDLEQDWAVQELKEMLELEDVRVLFVLRNCWKCKRECVAFYGLANNYAMNVTGWLYWPDILETIDQARRRFNLARYGCVKPRFSKTVGREYVCQGCSFCDALIGEYPLQEDLIAISREMELRDVPNQCRVDWPPRSLRQRLP